MEEAEKPALAARKPDSEPPQTGKAAGAGKKTEAKGDKPAAGKKPEGAQADKGAKKAEGGQAAEKGGKKADKKPQAPPKK